MICAICGFEHNNTVQFAKHIHAVHNLTSQEYYDTYILCDSTPVCPVCKNKPRKFKSILFGYFPCCSEKCSKSTEEYKQKISEMRKRTAEHASVEYKNTCLQKYGQTSVFKTDNFKHKSTNTKNIRYNDSKYNNREKARNTCNEKYDAPTYAASIEGRIRQSNYLKNSETACKFGSERYKNAMLMKYGVENPMQSDVIRNKSFSNSAKKLNKLERKMYEFLTNRHFNFCYNYCVNGKNFDFAIFDDNNILKTLIEIDGEYWHGLNSDSDGRHVRGETDCERFSKVPEGVKFIACDSKNFELCIIEILNTFNINYEEWLNSIIKSLPNEFPYHVFTNKRLLTDWQHLCNYDYNKHSYVGMSIVKHHHRSIYEAHRENNISPVECWKQNELLIRCVKNRIIYKSNLSSHNIAEGFNICGIAKTVSVFNPILAKHIVKTYLQEFNTVFDPFSGFSGRMLGACACGKTYIGQDINETHVKESNEIIKLLQIKATINQKDIFESTGEYECLFTCSPYKLKEVWNENETNKTCDEWIDECIQRFKCKRYVFVVDNTEKYKDYITEEISNKSHFSNSKEYIIVID